MPALASARLPARKWGPGTAAIVRLLIAANAPLTQVAIAEAAGVTQPRASQVLKRLAEANAVTASVNGYRGKRARLLDLYAQRARPHLVEPDTLWYSTRPLIEQAHRVAKAARRISWCHGVTRP
jgi:DNA-binding GntR family transcriptional regulator